MPSYSRIDEPVTCCDADWEAAYLAFESPSEEVRKFTRRLLRAGANDWPRTARIVEICCGRGNGLEALSRLGFANLEGVDLSESLLSLYGGRSPCYVCDCRQLPFGTSSRDVVIVHGGLHHLKLPGDLAQSVQEVARVLCHGGLFLAVEPWMTPFLALVHMACSSTIARRVWRKLDAMAAMNDRERDTYERWLHEPALILNVLSRGFDAIKCEIRFGKLLFVGQKRAENALRT